MAKYKITFKEGSDGGLIDMFGYAFAGTRTGNLEIILSIAEQMEMDKLLLERIQYSVREKTPVPFLFNLSIESVEKVD